MKFYSNKNSNITFSRLTQNFVFFQFDRWLLAKVAHSVRYKNTKCDMPDFQ